MSNDTKAPVRHDADRWRGVHAPNLIEELHPPLEPRRVRPVPWMRRQQVAVVRRPVNRRKIKNGYHVRTAMMTFWHRHKEPPVYGQVMPWHRRESAAHRNVSRRDLVTQQCGCQQFQRRADNRAVSHCVCCWRLLELTLRPIDLPRGSSWPFFSPARLPRRTNVFRADLHGSPIRITQAGRILPIRNVVFSPTPVEKTRHLICLFDADSSSLSGLTNR